MDRGRVLITGGTRGIGRALVQKFASAGFDVATCGRNERLLTEVEAEIRSYGVNAVVQQCDVRSRAELEQFVNNSMEALGGIDVVINNAGVFIPGRIQDEDDETFSLMMETNLNATYHVCKLTIPYLKKSGKPHLFNICSTASITPYINGGTYCISKYAQYGLTKVLREELKEDGVKVTAILPGATYTSSWEGTELPESRFMNPASVADIVFQAYQLPKEAVIEEILARPMQGDIS